MRSKLSSLLGPSSIDGDICKHRFPSGSWSRFKFWNALASGCISTPNQVFCPHSLSLSLKVSCPRRLSCSFLSFETNKECVISVLPTKFSPLRVPKSTQYRSRLLQGINLNKCSVISTSLLLEVMLWKYLSSGLDRKTSFSKDVVGIIIGYAFIHHHGCLWYTLFFTNASLILRKRFFLQYFRFTLHVSDHRSPNQVFWRWFLPTLKGGSIEIGLGLTHFGVFHATYVVFVQMSTFLSN